jgi:hypothetical protein
MVDSKGLTTPVYPAEDPVYMIRRWREEMGRLAANFLNGIGSIMDVYSPRADADVLRIVRRTDRQALASDMNKVAKDMRIVVQTSLVRRRSIRG